jgi:folate-dependent phosphoribosylglycinamide formyltransferase PurN
MMNIGLLTSRFLSEFAVQTLKPVLEDDSFTIRVAVIDSRPGKSLLQKLKKNFRRGRGGYMLIMAFKSFFSRGGKSISTIQYCNDHGIEVIETTEPYSEDTAEKIRNYSLDVLVLTGGYGIVKEPLLSITPKGVLSYHHGDMRKYRGMPFGFWELYNNEKEMGLTVQILSPGLDCGIPVVEKSIEIQRKDTLKSLQIRALHESKNMLYSALKTITIPEPGIIEVEKPGKLYTLPDLRQWLFFKMNIFRRKLGF